jgi:selenide,water dikinase
MDGDTTEPRLTALAHGGGCGCKLAPNVLAEILARTPLVGGRTELIVDASTSDDAAVWRVDEKTALIATTDFFTPIVDDPFDFGRIAAANALSDVYAMGGRPIFALAIVGMPIGKLATETIQRILQGGRSVAEAAGAPIAGGHSIDSAEPIYGLVALGLAAPDRILRNSAAKPGDALILGKPLGVGVYSAALKRGTLDAGAYDEMIAATTRLNTPGPELAAIAGVHAATDVTGFGLFGHLAEMCRGADVGAVVNAESVPAFPNAVRLVREGVRTGASARNWASVSPVVAAPAGLPDWRRDLFCDPQTSGGLLVACAPESVEDALAVFRRHGHAEAAVIGRIETGPPGIAVA